jgi:hypothetical protein
MRTTLDLDKPVIDGLKALQKTEKRSLSRIASRLLAEALDRQTSVPKKPASLTWTARKMGARIDLADKDAVYRILDQK